MRRLLVLALILALLASAALATETRTLASILARAKSKLKGLFDTPASNGCISWGDTHMIPFGGANRYDIQSPTPFLLIRYDPGDKKYRFEVQPTMTYAVWGSNTVDNHFAIRCGLDIMYVRQARDGSRVTMEMNGRSIPLVGQQPKEVFPSAPNGRGLWYAKDISPDNTWDTFEISCGYDEFSNSYASGFKLSIGWWRGGGNLNAIYGNARVEASDRYTGKLWGACGWLPSGEQPSSHNWVLDTPSSLFGLTPADHAKEAKEGRKVDNPADLSKDTKECKDAVQKHTGIDVDNIPDIVTKSDSQIKKALDDYIAGCAYDNYYGADHDGTDMYNQVCSWIASMKSTLSKEMTDTANKISSCAKPFVDPKEYAPFLQEKFVLDHFCNPSPPDKADPMPNFPNCAEEEAEANAKKTAEEQAKTHEANMKEEETKVLKKVEEKAKSDEQTAKSNGIKEQKNKADEKIKAQEQHEKRMMQEKKEKRAREQSVKNKDEQNAKKRFGDEKEEQNKKVKDPNGDFLNQKTSIIMLK